MRKIRYLPSIDSLRALAVISVIIYHCSSTYLPGGFLGVDLFFVLSGYLITSLLIIEYKNNNKINLKQFYIRRARRLLPAVYFMISIVLVILVLFNKYLLNKSYLDGVFGYIYASNWWYIFHKLDYFDTFGSASPFKHLWSLAIEEQFYMFFPLLIILFISFAKLNWKKVLKIVVIILILSSLITHIVLYDFNNINRVYYGTDTRMFELLIGSLGALVYPMNKLGERIDKKTGTIFSAVSFVSIILFIVCVNLIGEYSAYLYRGGFLFLSVLFLIMIITTGQRGTIISKIMSFKPLVFIGKISYSLYLWHFPILVLTTPTDELHEPNLIFNVIRIIVIFAVAYFSYTFIENPIRKNGFKNYCERFYIAFKSLPKKARNIAIVFVTLFSCLFLLGVSGKAVPYLSTLFVKEYEGDKKTEFNTGTNNGDTNSQNISKLPGEEHKYRNVILIGDSLAVDIGNEFSTRYPGAIINGKVSRQVYDSTDIAKQYANFNNKDTAVVFLLGTNGIFDEKQLEELLQPVKETDVYFINTRVPRVWEKSVNQILADNQEKLNYTLVDWHELAKNHKEYFAKDQVHLKQEGVVALVDLLSSKFKYSVETQTMIEIKKQEEERKRIEEEQKLKAELEQKKAEENNQVKQKNNS